jgi:hypothetical protein
MDWRLQYIAGLKKELCLENKYFPECYRLSKVECEKNLELEFQRCHSKVKLPVQITSLTQSIYAGAHYGSCIGNLMEQKFVGKLVKTQKCTQRSQW